jgi:all-trans-retinol 13,14-reductase
LKSDAVVIGSGISGLTVAAFLAKKGKKVILLEQHRRPGGAMKRFSRKGIGFDIGFHYTGGLGQGQVLRAIWDYLGVLPELEILPFPETGCDAVKIPGFAETIKLYFSYQKTEESLCSLFPDHCQAVKTYLSGLQDICRQIPFFNPDLPLLPFLRNYFDPTGIGLSSYLRSLTSEKYLQSALASPVFLYGVPPDKASLAMHAMVSHALFSGAYFVKGGGQAIVDAFISILKENGAEVFSNNKVNKINVCEREKKVCSVELSDDTIETENVIYTGHPTGILDLVKPDVFRPAFCHRLKNVDNSIPMFIVFAKADGKAKNQISAQSKLAWNNNYCLGKGLNFLDTFPETPWKNSMLMTAPSLRDSNHPGVILMRTADWQEVEPFAAYTRRRDLNIYQDWKSQATQELITRADDLWGESLVPLASGSPLTFRDEFGTANGGAYGIAHSIDQIITGARTKVNGLWFSGQSTLMTGVMGSSLSGLVTAGEITGMESLWSEVRKWI